MMAKAVACAGCCTQRRSEYAWGILFYCSVIPKVSAFSAEIRIHKGVPIREQDSRGLMAKEVEVDETLVFTGRQPSCSVVVHLPLGYACGTC